MKEDSLKESEKLMCFLSLLIFSVLLLEADYWDLPFPFDIFVNDKRGSFVILIIIAGLLLSYYYNRKGDGRQFVERFICMGWFLTFQLYVFFFLGITAIAFVFSTFFHVDFVSMKKAGDALPPNPVLFIEMIICLDVVSWIRWIADRSDRYDAPSDMFLKKK